MIKLRSIRTRILLWFVSALFLIMTASSFSFYFYMKNFLYTNAERLIRDKNFAVGGWIDFRNKDMNKQVNEYKQSQEATIFIQVSDLNRKVIGRTSNLQLTLPLSKTLANKVFNLDNVVITSYQSPQYGELLIANGTGLNDNKILGFVQVAIQKKEITKTLDSVFRWVLVSVPILLLLSFVLGYFLTKRLIAPFALISASAKRISFQELNSSRLPVVNPQDELGKLTITINDLLNRLNEAINSQHQFVADAAHELRTPLAIMQSEIEISLKNESSVEALQQILKSNLEEVQRLTSITHNLIVLTRFDADKSFVEKSSVHFGLLCQQVVDRFRIRLIEHEMICEMKGDEDVVIHANKAYLEQMLINIIDNAIKYSPSNSTITIIIKQLTAGVSIEVKDRGVGIPADELPFVFNRFYRVDRSRSSKIPGSGLGLAIVKSIIDYHQGNIEIKSELGKGTEIFIQLP